jgi:hypothetical protein
MMTLNDAFSVLTGRQQADILTLRSHIEAMCPNVMKALRLIDIEYTTPKRPKGYNLAKRDNRKLGFVYYVRYWHEGNMLPSKWCTHTNNLEQAREFAEQNRNELIARYLRTRESMAVRFFKKFYAPDSEVYRSECKRNGELSEGRRKRYHSVMINKFIPFLKKHRIGTFNCITVNVLDDFQDYLLAGGMKAQSVNDDMTAVHKAFKYLLRKGQVKENPCTLLPPVPERQTDKKTHDVMNLPN